MKTIQQLEADLLEIGGIRHDDPMWVTWRAIGQLWGKPCIVCDDWRLTDDELRQLKDDWIAKQRQSIAIKHPRGDA